jgi:hypothetical protein
MFKKRLSEPSTWAGLGLLCQGLFQLAVSKGADTSAWTSVAAGFGAVFLPEKSA